MESEVVDWETRVLNLNPGNSEDLRHEVALIGWEELLNAMTLHT